MSDLDVQSSTSSEATRSRNVERTERPDATRPEDRRDIADATSRVSGTDVQGAAAKVAGAGGTDGFQRDRPRESADARAQEERDRAAREEPGMSRTDRAAAGAAGAGGAAQPPLQPATTEARTVEEDRRRLNASPSFQRLDPATRAQAMETLGRHPTDAGARRAVRELASSPGFGELNRQEQGRLLDYVGGTNGQISAPARQALSNVTGSEAYRRANAADQAKMLRDYTTSQPGAPQQAGTTAPRITDRAPYTIGQPTEVKNAPFHSGPADGRRYDVNIDGRTIPVTMPANVPPGSNLPTIDQVAQGLSALPRASRDAINEVHVNPGANPADAHWARVYNTPNFRSYMTAGAAGTVNIYPAQNPVSQNYLEHSLVHETGHITSQRQFGTSYSDPRWSAWQSAMQSDGFRPSGYARNSPGEDFSESLLMYQSARGNPTSAAELRRIFPERFRILDSMFGGR